MSGAVALPFTVTLPLSSLHGFSVREIAVPVVRHELAVPRIWAAIGIFLDYLSHFSHVPDLILVNAELKALPCHCAIFCN